MAVGAYVMQLGEVPYLEAWELQRSLAGAVSQGAIPDTVRYSFYVGAVVFMAAVSWTVFTADE